MRNQMIVIVFIFSWGLATYLVFLNQTGVALGIYLSSPIIAYSFSALMD